jgi:hypothetical protein
MKKIILAVFAVALLTSCGGGKSGEKENKENKTEEKVSAEMKGFMEKLDGKSTSVEAALKEFGKDSLDAADMEMFNLEKPTIEETNGNCYLLRAKSGMTHRKYNMCWEGGKIVSVEDKGME